MRIAVLFDNFGPYHAARLTAASRECELLGIEIAGRSAEYDWTPTGESPGFRRVTLLQEETSAGAKSRDLRMRLNEVLSSFRAEVVAIPGWSSHTAILALLWCIRQRVPAILMSESQAIDEPRHVLKEWVKSRCLRAFSAALVGGQSHRQYVIQLGMPPERVFLGYDAVDNDYFARGTAAVRADAAAIRNKFSLPERYFLASNRFIPKKNLPFLLRAFAAYRKACLQKAWDLVLLGDGPLRPEITSLITGLSLDENVRLPGFRQYDELPAYYGLAGAFVHASTTEQWGLVVNEAMASGLPVLVSNRCGCAAELLRNGKNGYQFDPTDEAELAGRMAEVADNEERRCSMGRASLKRIQAWGLDRFGAGLQAAAEYALRAGTPGQSKFDDWILRLLAARI